MRAVVEEAWTGLFRDLSSLAAGDGVSDEALVDAIDTVARRRKNARIGAWLLLSGQGLPEEVFEGSLSDLPLSRGGDPQEAQRALLAVAAALFGDAIFGERLRQVLGMPDGEEERRAFRAWLAERVLAN